MIGVALLGESVGASLLTVGIYETIRQPHSSWPLAIVSGALIVVCLLVNSMLPPYD